MVKRLLEEVLQENSNPDDLEKFAESLLVEVKRLRALPAKDRVLNSIVALEDQYYNIEWGSHWKSEKTQAAVRVLESINFEGVMKEITAIKDSCRWELALLFTKKMAGVIFYAEGAAFKLVNGSCGEWCGDTADAIDKFWKTLIQTQKGFPEPVRIPEDVIREIETEKFKKCLGDYSDSLSFVAVEALKLSAVTEENPAKGKEFEKSGEKAHQNDENREVIIIEL
jgi:hypothetical protein